MTMTLSDLRRLKTLVRGERPAAQPAKTFHDVDLTLIAEVLVAARAEIANPHRWMQRGYGVTRDRSGLRGFSDFVLYGQRQIEGLCSWGAIGYATFWNVGPRVNREAVERAATELFESAIGCELTQWNDAPERTHSEVVAAFDRAIAMAVGAWR